jgi:hypothetical protein
MQSGSATCDDICLFNTMQHINIIYCDVTCAPMIAIHMHARMPS